MLKVIVKPLSLHNVFTRHRGMAQDGHDDVPAIGVVEWSLGNAWVTWWALGDSLFLFVFEDTTVQLREEALLALEQSFRCGERVVSRGLS